MTYIYINTCKHRRTDLTNVTGKICLWDAHPVGHELLGAVLALGNRRGAGVTTHTSALCFFPYVEG